MQLVKFLAHTGLCPRRKASLLITQGHITINNTPIQQPHYKVLPHHQVKYQGNILKPEKKIYILLNKPKGIITTVRDERGRKTVQDLINLPEKRRIYPVGRLDRHTVGLLLLTNDGDLSQRLAHPSYNIQKTYEVTLARPISNKEIAKIKEGIHLDDGPVHIDSIHILNPRKTKLSITLHAGKNRVIRRLFAHFNYSLNHLERTIYATLTKQNLRRGTWRFLHKQELHQLRQLATYV